MSAANGSSRNVEAVQVGSLSSKRKNAPKEDEEDDDSGDESGSDVSMVNVDFDFYNLNPNVDLIAVKRLLRQTLSHDNELIDVHPLAELILAEGVRIGAGSSIKTDGEESDPWGLVAVLDIQKHREHPAFKPFLDYLLSTIPKHNTLRLLLDSPATPAWSNTPALVFSLRLLNLPLPLIPPLYKMLLAELEEARKDPARKKEVPEFTHWLVWGRGYRLEGTEEGMGLDMSSAGKKSKKAKGAQQAQQALQSGSFPYHPEEEYIDEVATFVHTYPFKSAPPRDDESFGVEQFGRLVMVEGNKLHTAVGAMEEACKAT